MLSESKQYAKIMRAKKRIIFYTWMGFFSNLMGGILIYLSTYFGLVKQSVTLVNALTLYVICFYCVVLLVIKTKTGITKRFSQRILILQISNAGGLLFITLLYYPEIKTSILVLWIMAFAFTYSFGTLKQSIILSVLVFVSYVTSLLLSGFIHQSIEVIVSEVIFLCAFIPTCVFISSVGAKLKKQRDTTHRAKLQAEEALKIAAAANESKSVFLANMSHEIRTPMNAIINLSYLCLQNELEAKQRDYIEKLNNSAKSLLQIINDILDFSKVEAGKMEFEVMAFSLDEILGHLAVIDTFKKHGESIQPIFDITPGTPTYLLGDMLRINQILQNLLSNAIKFTDKGHIVLSISVFEDIGEQLKIAFEVQDSGLGMPQSVADNMFEPFSQADSTTTRFFGGSGLGLVIVKQLARLMSGDFSLISEPGKGTTARVILPLSIAPLSTNADITVIDKKVLLIAEDEHTRRGIKNTLTAFGVAVTDKASPGADEHIADAFDVLLIDESSIVSQVDIYQQWLQLLPKSLRVFFVSDNGQIPDKLSFYPIKPLKKPVYFSSFVEALLTTQFDSKAALETDSEVKSETDSNTNEVIDNDQRHKRKSKNINQRLQLSSNLYQQVGKQSILLVEDNQLNQEIIVDLLADSGADILVAENGQVALDLLAFQQVDVILMDIQMPVMDGLEATKKIRACPKWQDIPIIALTASAIKNDMAAGLAIGMNEYLTKPIIPEELFAALNRCCQNKHYRNTSEQAKQSEQQLYPGLDIKAALKTCNGKEHLFNKLIAQYYEKFKHVDEKILQVLADGDNVEASRIAHNLCGISANLGALSLADTARQISKELALPAETLSDDVKRRLKQDVLQVMTSIKQYLA